MAARGGADADTQRRASHSSRKRVTAVISKTQRVLLKAGGAGAKPEIAFPDDSFNDGICKEK